SGGTASMNVTVFGGSGFVGRHLGEALRARGDDVRIGSIRDTAAAAALAGGSDVVVNLAGEPLAQKWTEDVKARILQSRTALPHAFVDALASRTDKPRAYVSASAIGYYGTSEEATFTETSPPGDDFLARVCVAWEQEAQRAAELGMRVACVRSGLALGSDGGALEKLLPPFKMGTGGKAGSGKQWYSWIHIADLVGIYLLAIDGLAGAIDATAPNPVSNATFTRELGKALHRPTIFPIPVFAIKSMLGEGASVVLEGQRVLPERALAAGYAFRFSTIEAAFADILR
ncbi:MAG: TIGR01777 family oxidoreductase, partial [Rhodanobacteraceae bacterium]